VRTIFVVTHPEASHHGERIVGGWHDSSLTANGEVHAQHIAEALAERVGPSTNVEVYSSDLVRASESAKVIATRFGVGVIPMERLREKSYGEAEGRPQSWLDERFIVPPVVGDRMGHHEGVDGAETKGAFASRIYSALDTILASSCEHQLVVTHGFALTFVIAAWIGMPLDSAGYVNFKSSSGGITELHEDDLFHNRFVVRFKDISHLS